MNTNQCNSIQVSTNISVLTQGQPDNVSASFTATPITGLVSDEIVSVGTAAVPLPIGGIPAGQLGLVFLENLDEGNPLFVTTNSNGTAPFAQLPPQTHMLLLPVPGQAYYLYAGASTVAARVVVVGS